MQIRSSRQHRNQSESSDRVIASIKPRSWGDPHQHQAAAQPQPIRHDFSHVDLFAHDPGPRTIDFGIQPKLTIGAPNDVYEQEADRMAAQVVQRLNAPPPNPPSPARSQSDPSVQRETLPDEDELQMKPMADQIQRVDIPEEDELQMKSMVQRQAGEEAVTASTNLESSIQQARSGGQPLANTIRQPMEQAFGADFSGVKVHTDTQSDQLNRGLQAKAFTTGQDVFFRQGAYEPGSRGGQELIAHELTHVVQQGGGLCINRAFLEDPEVDFDNALGSVEDGFLNPTSETLLNEVRTKLSSVKNKYQEQVGEAVPEGPGIMSKFRITAQGVARTTLIEELLELQHKLAKWRHLGIAEPSHGKPFYGTLRKINLQIRALLRKLCDVSYEETGEAGDAASLVELYEPAMQGLAMRILASNASAFGGSAFSTGRNKRRMKEAALATAYMPPQNITSGKAAMVAAEQLEINEEGVCSEFAAAAYSLLQGKGVRVEMCGMTFGGAGHNLVVVGRQGPLTWDQDKTNWGADAYVIDIWKGVIDQQSWAVDGHPAKAKVVYTPLEHDVAFKGTPLTQRQVIYDPNPGDGSITVAEALQFQIKEDGYDYAEPAAEEAIAVVADGIAEEDDTYEPFKASEVYAIAVSAGMMIDVAGYSASPNVYLTNAPWQPSADTTVGTFIAWVKANGQQQNT